jgi:hypothetical protein
MPPSIHMAGLLILSGMTAAIYPHGWLVDSIWHDCRHLSTWLAC